MSVIQIACMIVAHLTDFAGGPLGGSIQPVRGLLFVCLGQVLLDKGAHPEHIAQHLQSIEEMEQARKGGGCLR